MFKWAFEGCMGHGWDWLHDARGQVSLGKPEPIHTNVYTRIFKIPPNRSFAPPCPRTTICANARLYHQNPECSMVFVLELFPFNRLSRSRRRKEKKKRTCISQRVMVTSCFLQSDGKGSLTSLRKNPMTEKGKKETGEDGVRK